jgi:ketosteroid isomerase-like protein/GNAT superfamily N-acetyltransferase
VQPRAEPAVLTRRVYESLNAGDIAAFLELLDPDVVLREGFLAPDADEYHGHDGVREWLARSTEAMEDYRFEPSLVMVVGDAVVVPVRMTARGSGSGAQVSADLVHVGQAREGKITLLSAHPDLQSALAAAGTGVEIAPEPFDAPDSTQLRAELATELVQRYDGDVEPGRKPSAEDLATFLVARDRRQAAVGCGALRALEDGTAEIKRMYVRPAMRGRGLGWVILAALEEEGRRLGFGLLRLETGDLQAEAMALYRAAGYREIPCFGAYVHGPRSRCFERRLGP